MTTFGEALVKLLEAHVGQVFSRFHAARPGPAYLEIPLDLLSPPARPPCLPRLNGH